MPRHDHEPIIITIEYSLDLSSPMPIELIPKPRFFLLVLFFNVEKDK